MLGGKSGRAQRDPKDRLVSRPAAGEHSILPRLREVDRAAHVKARKGEGPQAAAGQDKRQDERAGALPAEVRRGRWRVRYWLGVAEVEAGFPRRGHDALMGRVLRSGDGCGRAELFMCSAFCRRHRR